MEIEDKNARENDCNIFIDEFSALLIMEALWVCDHYGHYCWVNDKSLKGDTLKSTENRLVKALHEIHPKIVENFHFKYLSSVEALNGATKYDDR